MQRVGSPACTSSVPHSGCKRSALCSQDDRASAPLRDDGSMNLLRLGLRLRTLLHQVSGNGKGPRSWSPRASSNRSATLPGEGTDTSCGCNRLSRTSKVLSARKTCGNAHPYAWADPQKPGRADNRKLLLQTVKESGRTEQIHNAAQTLSPASTCKTASVAQHLHYQTR